MTRLQADRDEVISSIVSSLALEPLRDPIRSDVRFWRISEAPGALSNFRRPARSGFLSAVAQRV